MRRWEVLEKLIKDHGWSRGAEIGVLKGQTYKHLLTTCPDLELWGVDTWDTAAYAAQRKELKRPKEPSLDLEAVYRDLDDWRHKHARARGRLLRMDSLKAAAGIWIPDGYLDFVFIDADHRYEGCKADIRAWRPKARNVLGHDFQDKFPGVKRAVEEEFDKFELFDDSVWMGVS